MLLGFFQHGFRPNYYDDAVFCDGVAGAVGFEVVADYRTFEKIHVAVDDGAADAGVAADDHVIEDYGVVDLTVAIHAHIQAQYVFLYAPAGNYRAGTDYGIKRDAFAFGVGENKFCWRI